MAEIKSYVCPNCGANTTNAQNCEYCGSLLVRFVEKGIDLSNTTYTNDCITFPGLAAELKKNLRLQEENPEECVVTDLYAKIGDDVNACGILRTGYCCWQDDQDIELGNGSDGLIVIKSFDRYVDLNGTEDFNKEMDDRLSRFKQLDCFELFTSHTCTSVDEYGYKRYFREYAIDFGKDAEGAARLISEILQKVNGWTLETNFDMLTNVGDDADKARREWLEAHGFGGYEGDIDDDNDVSANQKYQLASQEYNGTQKSNSSDNIGIETTQTQSQPVKQRTTPSNQIDIYTIIGCIGGIIFMILCFILSRM